MGKESMQNRKPMILVLAGPNGSGKSTITTFLIKLVNILINIARIESRVAAGGHNVVGKNIRALSSSYPHFESPTY